MASGMLHVRRPFLDTVSAPSDRHPQDTLHPSSSSTSSAGPRFRPYASPEHHVTKGRYITSNDPRGYMCVLAPRLFPAGTPLLTRYLFPFLSAPCTNILSTVNGS